MKKKIKGFFYDLFGVILFIVVFVVSLYIWSDGFHNYVNRKIDGICTETKVDTTAVKADTIKVVNTVEKEKQAKDSIPLTRIDNTYYINVIINGVPMKLILDTGCDRTSLTNVEELFLQRHSGMKINAINNAKIADGSNINVTSAVLNTISIGKSTFNNIDCDFIQSQDAEPLLGQNVLSLLGTVAIDYKNNYLLVF